jgi:hypothetical protein
MGFIVASSSIPLAQIVVWSVSGVLIVLFLGWLLVTHVRQRHAQNQPVIGMGLPTKVSTWIFAVVGFSTLTAISVWVGVATYHRGRP